MMIPSHEPSDQDLYDFWRDYWISTSSPQFGVDPVDFARAVLARWGHQSSSPADGEVGELVEWLQANSSGCYRPAARAADLLERLSAQAPQPVPVGERLPGAEDCDAEGRCWAYDGKHLPAWETSPWQLRKLPDAPLAALNERSLTSNYFWRNTTHWLPANALPIPQEES